MAEVEVVGGFCFGVTHPEEDDIENKDEDDEEEEPPPPPPQASLAPLSGRGRRQTVSAEVYHANQEANSFQPTKYPKSAEDTTALEKALVSHYLFKHLDDRELAKLVEFFEPRSYKPGEGLCEDSESADTSLFYVILEGTVEIRVDDKPVRTVEAVGTCGETEMMYNQPRTEFFFATTPVRAFCIDRRTYQRTLQKTFTDKRAMYCGFLKNVRFLEGLSRREMVQLADCLEAQKFKAGEVLIHYNAPPDYMYIIMEGVVKVVGRDENNNPIDVCEFTNGAIVGEMEFLNNHNNVADVVAKSDEVRAASLERKHFEMCMGSLKDMLKSCRKEDPVYDYYHKKRALSTADASQDPEKGLIIEVTSNRLPYTYAGQVKSLMKEGQARITLDALGRASEIAVTTANRLRESKLVTVRKIGTHLSSRGVAGIRITLDKAPEFDQLVTEVDAREAAAKSAGEAAGGEA